jgi:hypothetical protein
MNMAFGQAGFKKQIKKWLKCAEPQNDLQESEHEIKR